MFYSFVTAEAMEIAIWALIGLALALCLFLAYGYDQKLFMED